MSFTAVQISDFQIFSVFLYIFSAMLQVAGIHVLYHTKYLRAIQRMILINIGVCHLGFSIYIIFKLSYTIINGEEPSKFTDCFAYVRFTIYPLLILYLSIDRMLEIYLHLKYPIYVTKKCSYFIVKVLWVVILTIGVIIGIVIHYHPTDKKVSHYLFLIMSLPVLFAVIFVYIYIYKKWKTLRHIAALGKTQYRPRKSTFLIIPFLVVFTFVLCEGFAFAMVIVEVTIEPSGNTEGFIHCIIFTLLAVGGISDAFVYIFLQKHIRNKLCLKIKTFLVKASCSNIQCLEMEQKQPCLK